MNKKITILIANFNTSHFIETTLYALKELTFNPYQVIISDNGSNSKDVAKLTALAAQHENVLLQFRNFRGMPASLAHGTGLDVMVSLANTPYGVIMDSDAIILKKHWDSDFIEALSDQTPIIGTPRTEEHKDQNATTADFPSIYIVMFKKDIFDKLSISFKPMFSKDGHLIPDRDTGWELKNKYTEAGLKGTLLRAVNTRNYQDGPFRDLIGVAEFYSNDGKILGAHFGRGATLGKAKYKKGKSPLVYKLPVIGSIAVRNKGLSDGKLWNSICRSIVQEQL